MSFPHLVSKAADIERIAAQAAVAGVGTYATLFRACLGGDIAAAFPAHPAPLFSNGRAWAGMPGKPLIVADGAGLRDDKGKQRYTPVLEWTSREASDRFSQAVVGAVQQQQGSATLNASKAA